MNGPKPFGLYTAEFPFLDTEGTKIRPIIVLSLAQSKHKIVAVVPVSSRLILEGLDVVLGGWKQEGLLRPSVARVHRLTTLLQSDLRSEIGVLEPDDIRLLQDEMRKFLSLYD